MLSPLEGGRFSCSVPATNVASSVLVLGGGERIKGGLERGGEVGVRALEIGTLLRGYVKSGQKDQ